MKFMFGFITGAIVGGFIASNMTDEQRAKTSDAASRATQRVQGTRVGRSVSSNVGQVSDAASSRVANAVDSAGESLTDAIRTDTN